MNAYPLIFKFKDMIAGPGFLAGVQIEGRVLMVEEKEDGVSEWWLNGVSPGGIAQEGATPQEAYLNFREFFRGVLEDLAVSTGNFVEFQKSVNNFIMTENKVQAAIWTETRNAIRSGSLKPDGPFSDLDKITVDAPARVIECIRLDAQKNWSPSPKDNPEYVYSTAA
ncbi:MAG TPA: hypothetical protein VMV05_06965 [bacterium]|nr:hypothetical protein [bacterium]